MFRRQRSFVLVGITFVLLCSGWKSSAETTAFDQVILNNGDHFSGHVVSQSVEIVSLATEDAGTIQVRRGAIKQLLIAAEQGLPPQNRALPAQPSTKCMAGGKPVPSSWSVRLNGMPAKVVLGTQSQVQFGAGAGLNFCEGSQRNATSLAATGSHTRTYQQASAAIQTDTAGAELEQQHFFHSVQGPAVFAAVDLFTNNSLGMALQKSFGVGLLSPQLRAQKLFYDFSVDARYVNEHLDHTAHPLNLAGLRFKQQTHLQSAAFSWNEQAWIMPMLNDMHAWQAYASLGPTVTIKPWLKVGLTGEESYLGNAPKPNRKNYFATSLSVTIQSGSQPLSR